MHWRADGRVRSHSIGGRESARVARAGGVHDARRPVMTIETKRWQSLTGDGFAGVAVAGGIATVLVFLAFMLYLYVRTP